MHIITLNASFWSFQYINSLLLVDNFYASFDTFLDKHFKLDHYGQQYILHVTMKRKMLFSIFCVKISIHLETLFDGFISIEVSFVVDVQSFLLYHCITTEGYWNTMARPLLRNFPFGNSIDNFIILFEAIIISFYSIYLYICLKGYDIILHIAD